jgi:hypothetical protein
MVRWIRAVTSGRLEEGRRPGYGWWGGRWDRLGGRRCGSVERGCGLREPADMVGLSRRGVRRPDRGHEKTGRWGRQAAPAAAVGRASAGKSARSFAVQGVAVRGVAEQGGCAGCVREPGAVSIRVGLRAGTPTAVRAGVTHLAPLGRPHIRASRKPQVTDSVWMTTFRCGLSVSGVWRRCASTGRTDLVREPVGWDPSPMADLDALVGGTSRYGATGSAPDL